MIDLWRFIYSQRYFILAGGITLLIFLVGYGFGYLNSFLSWRKRMLDKVNQEIKEENIALVERNYYLTESLETLQGKLNTYVALFNHINSHISANRDVLITKLETLISKWDEEISQIAKDPSIPYRNSGYIDGVSNCIDDLNQIIEQFKKNWLRKQLCN